jgi:8-oxo-dGTP pyrophosphatase MutT (NUDIX family)
LLSTEDVADLSIFRVRHDRYRLGTSGGEQDFVILEAPDWVNIVPVTAQGEVVLVNQYRHGIRRATLEIPGGVIDPHESPEAAAVRELEEETGYVPDRVELLGRVTPNPAFLDNHCYSYLAEGCRKTSVPKPDPMEHIEVLLRPIEKIADLIRRQEISNSMVINAFAFMGLLQRGTSPRAGPDGLA